MAEELTQGTEMKEIEAPQVDSAFKPHNEDPGFLVAKGKFRGSPQEQEAKEKDHRSKLANAIYVSVTNHGYAHVRAIGTNAIANAVRSMTSATDRCRKKGISLLWESVLEKGNLGPVRHQDHVQDVTAYSFKIQQWRDLENKNE